MDKTDLPCEGRIQGKVQSRAAHAIRSSANGALEWGQW